MSCLKATIICISAHHGNTMKVADAMAKNISAEIKSPIDIDESFLEKYDLFFFGSGIYNGRHHKALFNLLEKLPEVKNKKAAVFSTNTFGLTILHKDLNEKLKSKGFSLVGEFSCHGFSDYAFLKYFFGGINKGRPNNRELEKAKDFAKNVCK